MRLSLSLVALGAILLGVGAGSVPTSAVGQEAAAVAGTKIEDVEATLKTDKGDIKVTIYASKAPVTAANFLNLAKRDYYDGVSFHRVVEDFVIQGGDPSGTGRGGPGYFIENEIAPGLKHDRAGILSMARKREPDTNGSQFFITLGSTPHLNDRHSVFGRVTSGMDVVDAIGSVPTGPMDRPMEPVVIEKLSIRR